LGSTGYARCVRTRTSESENSVAVAEAVRTHIESDGRSDWLSWLELLPGRIETLRQRWSVDLGEPYEDATCSFVAPVLGEPLVLKIGLPHMEADHEAVGLDTWAGRGAVRLRAHAPDQHGMLLERCQPGFALRRAPEAEQDRVIAELLQLLWQAPARRDAFRPLSEMTAYWASEIQLKQAEWPDPALVCTALELYQTLPDSDDIALLPTDLHAGNVLKSTRSAWLAIDPKPFLGDRAFDATQHLLNCAGRLAADPMGTIARMAQLASLDPQRLRLWTFARVMLHSEVWGDPAALRLARRLAP